LENWVGKKKTRGADTVTLRKKISKVYLFVAGRFRLKSGKKKNLTSRGKLLVAGSLERSTPAKSAWGGERNPKEVSGKKKANGPQARIWPIFERGGPMLEAAWCV